MTRLFLPWVILVCATSAMAGLRPWRIPSDSPLRSNSETCNCGWVNRGRIVGGSETLKNEYPFMISMEAKEDFVPLCGGAIITPWHVLTAAHCTDGMKAEDIVINAGAHSLAASMKKPRINVSKIYQHAGFSFDSGVDDIALLVTSSEIKFSQNVGPVCMPTKGLEVIGKTVKAIGWGDMDFAGDYSDVLRGVDLNTISYSECVRKWKNSNNTFVPKEGGVLCTSTLGKDTCQGDSGGPILWMNPSAKRYTLVGIVSYGDYCGEGSVPSVNTKVAGYLSWINERISESKPGVKICSKK